MAKSKASSDTVPAPGPWYREGLQFECTACGKCCGGAPGYVWLNKAEVEAIAGEMAIEVDSFREKYVREVGIRHSLRERRNGDCVLLDPKTRRCTVYKSRPRQCRTWPFWDSNVETPEDWQRTCEICPGSGVGKLYSLDAIEAQRGVIRI